jgi:polysaccharide export outer membrane protein
MSLSFSARSPWGLIIGAVGGLLFAVNLHAQSAGDATAPPVPASPDTASVTPAPDTGDTSAPAADSNAAKPAVTSGSYVLQNNDLVRITVFQEEDLTTETRISKNGSITFPLLGALQLAGKTVAQAQEEIRSRLDKDYIVHPQVTVAVIDYSKLRVTVLGEVQHPGYVEIPTEGGLDLLGAIALASGFTPDSDSDHVNVRRVIDGKEVILSVNATELARDPGVKPFMMQPGDAITVPYIKKWVTVLGEVQRPGKIVLPSEGQLDLLGAVALAGGYTLDAEPEKVDVRRTVDGHDTVLTVNATELAQNTSVKPFLVQPGDSIIVHYNQDWVTILGEVQRPGKVKIPPEGGLDLLGAIALASGFGPNADTAHISVRRTVNGKDEVLNVNAKRLSHDTRVGAFMVLPGDNITVPQRMF